MNSRSSLSETPYRFKSAFDAYHRASRGESLTNLRERRGSAAKKCLGWLTTIVVGLACAALLFAGPELITTIQGENPPMGPAMIGMVLIMTSFICLLHGGLWLPIRLIELGRLSWKLRGTKNLTRTPREELELQNTLHRLAEQVRNSRLLIYWCESRFGVYERLRDSGQVERHPEERTIKLGIDRLVRQVEEETRAVDGLLMTHKSTTNEELQGLINQIKSREGLHTVGTRLMLLSTMDPTTQHDHYIAANKYEYPGDPAIGELLPILQTRLNFA